MKKSILYSLFLLSCFVLNAQYWTAQHFNVENGLVDNYTFAIEKFQDEIYVATDGGLVTFDGSDFKMHNKKEIRYPVSLLNVNDSILYVASWLDGILAKNQEEIKGSYPERINRILKYKDKYLIYNIYQRMALLGFNSENKIDTIINLEEIHPNPNRIAIDEHSIFVSKGKEIDEYDWKGVKKRVFPYKATETIETIKCVDKFLFFGDQHGNLTWVSKKNPAQKFTHHFKKPYTIKHIEAFGENQILVQLNHRAEYNTVSLITFDETFSKIIKT
ncbi:MAG: hypothetical protein AB8B65_13345, partial [Kordia sp.]|uniref:hypothetical protein n=1 Tax=Kordia sp. TaxID=1965332 RepID=UPI0038585145